MARNIRIRDNLPPWPATTRAGAILVITGGFLVYLYVNQQQTLATKPLDRRSEIASNASPPEVIANPAAEIASARSTGSRLPQAGPVDSFDLPQQMQPLSVPAPRHRSAQETNAQDSSTPSFQAETLNSDSLKTESLDFQQRLETFGSQWTQAQNEASAKFLGGKLPELDAEDQAIDQRFAKTYGAQLAPQLNAEKEKLLRSLPGVESHQDYEHPQTVGQLMDIERDFTELRTIYLRKTLTTSPANGLQK